ncbi:hypothetical protein G6011_11298 [Alternaria panax]|uniref:Uncharacterized protein n=1 Tax=Alternaria panax TaxID=48097 RepID=A0AAD4NS39_9PLEO|nr:hypothetical protein G6011_11298 [Alternaria panax]
MPFKFDLEVYEMEAKKQEERRTVEEAEKDEEACMGSNSDSEKAQPSKTLATAKRMPAKKDSQPQSALTEQPRPKKTAKEGLAEIESDNDKLRLARTRKTKSTTAATLALTERKTSATFRHLKEDKPEDSIQADDKNDAQPDPIDKPVKESKNKERKSSDGKTKDGKEKAVKHSNGDTQAQQHEQSTMAGNDYQVTTAMLREKVKFNAKEMLVWGGGLQWLRRKFIESHSKEAVTEYENARKAGKVNLLDVTGYYRMELLENVRLIEELGSGPSAPLVAQSDDRGTRSVSPFSSESDYISHYSNHDYNEARLMLGYIVQRAFKSSSWQVSSEEGTYQYATREDEAIAKPRGFDNAQKLVEDLCQLQMHGGKRFEEAKQTLSSVDVIWSYALDENRMVVAEGNESSSSLSPHAGSKIKLVQVWATFVDRFHIWQTKIDSGTTTPVNLENVLPPTKAGLKDLGRLMILRSPHIARPDSWPYLLAMALLTEKDLRAAEVEVGIAPSGTRFSDIIQSCLSQYQKHAQVEFTEAVHIFWLLQQSLQEEKPGNKTTVPRDSLHAAGSDVDTGDDEDSEHDEDGRFSEKNSGALSKQKNDSGLTSSKHERTPGVNQPDRLVENTKNQPEHEETEGGDAAPGLRSSSKRKPTAIASEQPSTKNLKTTKATEATNAHDD